MSEILLDFRMHQNNININFADRIELLFADNNIILLIVYVL